MTLVSGTAQNSFASEARWLLPRELNLVGADALGVGFRTLSRTHGLGNVEPAELIAARPVSEAPRNSRGQR